MFLNICEKIHNFLSGIKIEAHKRKSVFFLPHSVYSDDNYLTVSATTTIF